MPEHGTAPAVPRLARCAKCGGPIKTGQLVGVEPATATWTHEDERDCAEEIAKR